MEENIMNTAQNNKPQRKTLSLFGRTTQEEQTAKNNNETTKKT